MSDDPSFAVSFTARVDAARGAIAPGSPLVYDAAAGDWVLSTAANRATAAARTQAFALTYEGNSIIGTVSYQQAGILAQSLSGLLPGAQQLVRVTSSGGLERVSSYTTGDDIIGLAEPDGRVHLWIGAPITQILAAASAAAPASKFLLKFSTGQVTIRETSWPGYMLDGSVLEIAGETENDVAYVSGMKFRVTRAVVQATGDVDGDSTVGASVGISIWLGLYNSIEYFSVDPGIQTFDVNHIVDVGDPFFLQFVQGASTADPAHLAVFVTLVCEPA